MSRRVLKGAVLISGIAAAAYSTYKAAKEFIEYKKLKNKDIYINTEMTELSEMIPVIRKSICTGEEEAGFKDKSGNFTSYMLIRNSADLETFKKKYGIEGDISVEY